MKIIHTGDLHLGSALRNFPIEKAKLRQREMMDTFADLARYAKGNDVAAVLIAGDLFDGNFVSQQWITEVYSIIQNASPVAFFYVKGNHDDGVKIGKGLPENLHLFSQNGWTRYDLSESVTVSGMDMQYLDEGKYRDLCLAKEKFNVLLLHGEIVGNGTEKGRIALSRLSGKNVDYLALGHIHKPTLRSERLDARGKYRYCGCLESRGFDECGDRGFFLLEIENGQLRSERFLSLAKRNVFEIRADISGCETYFDVERTVLETMKNITTQNAVKTVLCGRHKAGLKKDLALLSDRLNSRWFFVKVEDETKLFLDVESFRNDLSEQGEFVREVGRYALNEELRMEILDIGLKALAGEEIDL